MTKAYKQKMEREPTEETKHKIRLTIHYMAQDKSDAWIANKLGYKNKSSIYDLKMRNWFWEEASRLKDKLPSPLIRKKRAPNGTYNGKRNSQEEYRRLKEGEPGPKIKRKIQLCIYYTAQGKPINWIAKKLGYKGRGGINNLKMRNWFWEEVSRVKGKLPNPVEKRHDQYDEGEVILLKRLHSQGFNDSQIANRIERSNKSICRHRNKLGLPPNGKPRNRYSEKEIEEIIRLRVEEKLTWGEIAEQTGRNKGHLAGVIRQRIGKTLSPRSHQKREKNLEKSRKEWETINPEIAGTIVKTPEYKPMFDAADD